VELLKRPILQQGGCGQSFGFLHRLQALPTSVARSELLHQFVQARARCDIKPERMPQPIWKTRRFDHDGARAGTALANNLVVFVFFWDLLVVLLYAMVSLGGREAIPGANKTLIIVGAGAHGRSTLEILRARGAAGLSRVEVLGFVDDDAKLAGTMVGGCRCWATWLGWWLVEVEEATGFDAGYYAHLQEKAWDEVAFTLADGLEYVRWSLERGLDIDILPPGCLSSSTHITTSLKK
jgi:hypothetical protein